MTRDEAIKEEFIRKLKNTLNEYPATYSDKIYDAVTIDEGIDEIEKVGIRKGLELAIELLR